MRGSPDLNRQAGVAAEQRRIGRIVRQVTADGAGAGDFEVTGPGAAAQFSAAAGLRET